MRRTILQAMEILKAFRYRLEPTPVQEVLFRRTAGCCRWAYNWALAARREAWRAHGEHLGYAEQANWLPVLKRAAGTDWLGEVPSHCLQQALRDLATAYKNFFEDLAKAGRGEIRSAEVRRPRFRSKLRHDSFRFPDPAQVSLDGDRLVLPKAGRVRLRLSRPLEGDIRHVTVVREGRHWFASILCRIEAAQAVPPARPRTVGLDVGVAHAVTASDGSMHDVPVPSRAERNHLRRLQRRVSRRQKGSMRRRRARQRLADYHRKLARRRHDALHKLSTALVKSHDLVALEDLRVKSMTASARGTVEAPGRNVRAKAGLNREILARGWAELRRQLEYKAMWAGKTVVAVPPANTSRRCNECGHTDPENRKSQARFVCRRCGHEANADVNAARNILELAIGITAAGQAAAGRGAGVRPRHGAAGSEAATSHG